jgi:hypothetical protein
MNIRKGITVLGVPYKWTTNLTDDEVREFHTYYSEQINEPNQKLEVQSTTIVFQFRMDFLPFLEGFCLWTATGLEQTVLYRSNQDWELWNARQEEIAELREEQAAEEAVEKQLVMTEDAHLKEKTNAAKQVGDFDAAAAFVTARAELRERFKQFRVMPVEWTCWYPDMILARFPRSRYGIDFFGRFRPLPQSFTNFGHWFSGSCGLTGEALVEETWKIYEVGMRLFPESGSIAQAASLFFRRVGKYDRATAVCVDAIKRGLRDGTKSGFEGRLKRLEKEAKQSGSTVH